MLPEAGLHPQAWNTRSQRRPPSQALCLSFDHALDLSSRLQLLWMCFDPGFTWLRTLAGGPGSLQCETLRALQPHCAALSPCSPPWGRRLPRRPGRCHCRSQLPSSCYVMPVCWHPQLSSNDSSRKEWGQGWAELFGVRREPCLPL